MSRALLASWRFHRGQQGSGTQLAVGALRVARAEVAARERGLVCRWEPDEGFDWSDHDEWCRKNCGQEHEVYYCVMEGDGSCLASLSGIIDPSREYRRVVEAELASEVLATMDANDVAIAG